MLGDDRLEALSVDVGFEPVTHVDTLDRAVSVGVNIGVGVMNFQSAFNPTPSNNGEEFLEDFINTGGVALSLSPAFLPRRSILFGLRDQSI